MWGFPGRDLATAESDAEGRFELRHVPAGLATLVARLDGRLESAPLQLQVSEGGERGGVELVLVPGARVAGKVRWPDGRPAAGVQVDVRFDKTAMMGMAAMNMGRGAEGTGRADETGRFEVTGLGKGPFEAG